MRCGEPSTPRWRRQRRCWAAKYRKRRGPAWATATARWTGATTFRRGGVLLPPAARAARAAPVTQHTCQGFYLFVCACPFAKPVRFCGTRNPGGIGWRASSVSRRVPRRLCFSLRRLSSGSSAERGHNGSGNATCRTVAARRRRGGSIMSAEGLRRRGFAAIAAFAMRSVLSRRGSRGPRGEQEGR